GVGKLVASPTRFRTPNPRLFALVASYSFGQCRNGRATRPAREQPAEAGTAGTRPRAPTKTSGRPNLGQDNLDKHGCNENAIQDGNGVIVHAPLPVTILASRIRDRILLRRGPDFERTISVTYILYHIKPNLHRAHDKKREMHQVLGGADIGPEPDDFFGLTVAAPQ